MGLFQVPWRDDFSVGTGISDFTGLPPSKPWAFNDSGKKALNGGEKPSQAIHGDVTISKGIMSSTSHYKHALHASTSMSVRLWGANAHASSKLLTELELNSKTVHYVVVCKFKTETVNKLDTTDYIPTLSKPASDLLIEVGPDKWAEQYGTPFIAGYVRGGSYLGKATIINHSTQGAHEFQAAMGAKFGSFASASGSAGMAFGHLKDKQETKIDIECTGANLDVAQPATIEEMIAFASLYAKNNKGVRHHAILQPFSALTGYNEAEALYKGKRLMIWVDNGSHLLQDLNFEYVRLQRLKYVLADKSQIATVPDMVCQDARKKVQTALHAFDVLQKPAEIQRVNSNSEVYDKKLCSCIFIADEVEVMLGVDISKLDVKCPTPESKPACEPAQPAPKDSQKHAHAESKQVSKITHGDTLHSDHKHTRELAEGQKLVSKDKAHKLVMQRDGNLVCYHSDKPVWSTQTNRGAGPFTLVMQADRNLVIYGAGHAATWSTKTCNHGVHPASLVMQNDGNIVLYDGQHKALWSRR